MYVLLVAKRKKRELAPATLCGLCLPRKATQQTRQPQRNLDISYTIDKRNGCKNAW